jgi:hypothetical protein
MEFLADAGELGRLISAFDWGATSVGPIISWPGYLRTTISTILRSPVAIVTLWNADGVMIYNDAYSVFAAARHPRLLGSRVREGWPEVADFNDTVMKTVLGGGTLSYRERELTLFRRGPPASSPSSLRLPRKFWPSAGWLRSARSSARCLTSHRALCR